MAVGGLPENGPDRCSLPTISRLESLSGPVALKRMIAAMIDLFRDNFTRVPAPIVLEIDDTEDEVHEGQQLALFNAHYDGRCFLCQRIAVAGVGVAAGDQLSAPLENSPKAPTENSPGG